MIILNKHVQGLRAITSVAFITILCNRLLHYLDGTSYYWLVPNEIGSIGQFWFVLLRILVCITSILSFLELKNQTITVDNKSIEIADYKSPYYYKNQWLKVFYIIIAVLFNPIFMFHLGKTVWSIIDLISLIVLIYHYLQYSKWQKIDELKDEELKKIYSEFEDISEYIKTDKKDEKN